MLQWKGLQGPTDEICLKELHWNCRVEHLHCRLESKQVYENTSKYPVEAVYTFALPRNAVVTDFEVRIGDKHLKAQVAAVSQAAETYEQAMEKGDMPVMVEHCDDGLCTVNIGGIAPCEEVVICITCEWMQPRVGDTVRVTIPTVVGERYSRDGSQGGLLPHQYVESSAFAEYPIKAHFEFAGQEYASARFTAPGFSPVCAFSETGVSVDINYGFADRDLVVTAENVPAVAYSYLLEDSGQYRGVAVLPIPNLSDEADGRALTLSLVVDCSGSMAGAAIGEAKRALASLPDLLTEADKLSLTLFGSEQEVVFKKAHACTRAFFRRDFIPKIEKIDAVLGGTEMAAALRKAAKYASGSADVLLMTDGEIWETEECIELVKNNGQRVFVIGIGNAANGDFCHRIAAATGGAAEMVLPTEDMTAAIARMIERMRRPALVVEDFAPKHFLYRNHLPRQIHSDESLILFFRFAKLPGQIPMQDLSDGSRRARIEGAPWKLNDNRGLLMIAANSELVDGSVDEPEEFARRYSLLSRWTSLILVNEREAAQTAVVLPKIQRIPQMMPDIWPCIPCLGTTESCRNLVAPPILRERMASYLKTLGESESDEEEERVEEKTSSDSKHLPNTFWLYTDQQLAVEFRFEDEKDRDRLRELAEELGMYIEELFYYYLQWLGETRNVPMPRDLVEFKDLPELQLDAAEKERLWSEFSKKLSAGKPAS